MFIRITFLILFTFLTACSGVQYQQPIDSQDSAELYVDGGIYVNSFSDEGCYSGRTYVEKNIKLHANKETFLSYEQENAYYVCRVMLSFVPEKDMKYQVRARKIGSQCSMSIVQIGSPTPVITTRLQLHQTSIACIKFE
jgi:hypothetical protein